MRKNLILIKNRFKLPHLIWYYNIIIFNLLKIYIIKIKEQASVTVKMYYINISSQFRTFYKLFLVTILIFYENYLPTQLYQIFFMLMLFDLFILIFHKIPTWLFNNYYLRPYIYHLLNLPTKNNSFFYLHDSLPYIYYKNVLAFF